MGAHFEALDEGILLVNLDPRYTQVQLNIISIQVSDSDRTCFPDSHKQQLVVMDQNHDRVISIRNRCSNAKSELSANLHQRMKWVVFIQDQISDSQQSLLLHGQALKRLERKLEAIEQLHLAPSMYMATVVEVVRRRAFSR